MDRMLELFTKKQLIELLTASIKREYALSQSMKNEVKVKVVSTKKLIADGRRSARV